MASTAAADEPQDAISGAEATTPDGSRRWPAPDRDSAKLGELTGTFEPEMELGALLRMEGRRGRVDADVEAHTDLAVPRARRWHKFYERLGIFHPYFGTINANTRLGRMGRFLRDAAHENGFERVTAREAAEVLRRYQFDNPVEQAFPPGESVHPYWAVLRAASELDWKLHWDELNRELMRIIRDDQLAEAIDRIKTARLDPAYPTFIGSNSNEEGLLRSRTHPADSTAADRSAVGQLRDQRMTPFLRRAGFGGLLLQSPGRLGGGYWTVPEHLRDIVRDIVRVPPEARRFSTKQEWVEWYCEGVSSSGADAPPPPPALAVKVKELTVSKLRAALDEYEKDLVFSDTLLANVVAALRSGQGRNFIILRGVSGTGKTRLVSAIAKAIYGAAQVDGPELTIVEVRPDWTDGSYLLGHFDPVGQRYVRRRFLDALISALNRSGNGEDHPTFVCLDEMNLARVEYYLADVLSAMESGSAIPLDTRSDTSVPSSVEWSPNLFLFGTINIDETTMRLSDKVLDRAQVIDTSDIDLLPALGKWLDDSPLADVEKARVAEIVGGVWTLLKYANAHFGFRTARSIVNYIVEAKASSEGKLPLDEAIDNQIMQKVLVKLRGEGERWSSPLDSLETLIAGLEGAKRSLQIVQGMRSDLERLGSFQFWG